MPDSNQIELAIGIEVVSIPTALNFYPRNLMAEIFQFRARQLRALNWVEGISYTSLPNSPEISESDLQDNPGTVYFTKSDHTGKIVGMIRLSPSIDDNGKPISMLGTTRSELVDEGKLPKGRDIYEGSRLVLDRQRLNTKEARTPVINELLAATVFFANQNGIQEFFGFMSDKVWESTYGRLGFKLTKIGKDKLVDDGTVPPYIVNARRGEFSEQVVKNVGLDRSILNFGTNPPKI